MASSSYLRAQKRQKEQEKRQLTDRLQGVERIIYKIDSQLDSYVSAVNSMISSCIFNIGMGIRGKARAASIIAEMREEGEKSPSSDNKISGSRGYLRSEQFRCQSRIQALESEISGLNVQIRRAEAAEAEEKRRALEAALKAVTGGV